MGFPRFPRSVVVLSVASLFTDISTEMLYPVLPLYLTGVLGAPATVVGLVEGIAEATQNIAQGGSGWLADRTKRNKPLALVGYTLSALSKPLIGFAVVWPQVLAARFADRLGAGIRSAPRDALIANAAGEQRRGAAFGLEGLGDNTGAFLGPLLAAGLLYVLHIELRAIFLLALIPGLIAVLLVTSVSDAQVHSSASPGTELTVPPGSYRRYLLAMGVFGIGNVSGAFIILRGIEVGLGPELALLLYAGYNLVAAIASYPVGRLSDAVGRKPVMVVSLALFAITYIGLALTTDGLIYAGLFALYGVHRGAFRAVGKGFAVDLVAPARRASGIGVYSATIGFTALVASGVGGVLWDRLGSGVTFAYGASFAILGTILLMTLVQSPVTNHRPAR